MKDSDEFKEPQHLMTAATSLPVSAGSSCGCGSSSLDADTPRGRDAIRWSRKGAKAFLRAYPTLQLAETDQSEPADIDGVLYSIMDEFNVIKGVMEIKTRYITEEILMGVYGGEWLITKDKLTRGRATAKSLKCPFVGLLVMPNSLTCMSIQFTDKDGEWTCEMREEVTKTSASCNGGEMTGLNAFICMKDAKKFKII